MKIISNKYSLSTVLAPIDSLERRTKMEKGTGIAIGVAIGIAIGVATGALGLWIAIGVVVGVLFENGEFDEWIDSWEYRTEDSE